MASVLVVDDDVDSRQIVESYLTKVGHSVRSACDGRDALVQLTAAVPDVVVLDLMMPQMNGVELARAIRKRPALHALKVIVLSSAQIHPDSLADAEVSAALTKPVRQSELYEAIAGSRAGAGRRAPAAPKPAEPALARKPVLIAEDNEINCAVARALLAKRGLEAEIARDGREAVAMAAAGDYAAIFMDCHMPELDGYQATRQIRDAANGNRVPIIAMTAMTMPGDRDRCLESGMDDYMPKPIRGEVLDEVIGRWLPGGAGGQQELQADPLAELEVLEEATVRQLLQALSPQMRADLMKTFQAQLQSCIGEIEQAVAGGDQSELRRVAHLLKGSSATFGALRLRECCLRLERTGREGDEPAGERQLELLRACAEQALGALAERLA
jgi:CheY-like chemotaxis protein